MRSEPRAYCGSRSYIADVKLLERVREGKWNTFQLLIDLAESGDWRWHLELHNPLLSQLYRLSGTLFTGEGIYVYPHVVENITCIAPRDATDFWRYLNSIFAHGLVSHNHREDLRFLSRVAARPFWDWSEALHQEILDTL
jgi:hypothetical protein